MMSYARLAQRAFVPAGAAATVASIGWISEYASSRVATQTLKSAVAPRLLNRSVRFSTSETSKQAVKTEASVAAETIPKASATTSSSVAAPTASAAAPTPPASGNGFLQWYEGHLQARPVVTKMFTGSFLWGVGDAVAQIIPQYSAGTAETKIVYDWPRTGRAAFFGFAIHAPTSHVHFNFLEYLTNRVGVTGLGIPVFKAFMEQFVYWSWISNSLYHGAMAGMQGVTDPALIYQRIADVLWDTQKAQWAFWIPIQLLNFRYIPVRHQLNVVLLTSIVWTALLSAWYPPEDNSDKERTMEIVQAASHD